MERILFLTFRNQQILLADCSDCSPEELAAVIDEVPKHVTREPLGSLLVLADFSRSKFTKETVEHLKLAAVFDRPHIKNRHGCSPRTFPRRSMSLCFRFQGAKFPRLRPAKKHWNIWSKTQALPSWIPKNKKLRPATEDAGRDLLPPIKLSRRSCRRRNWRRRSLLRRSRLRVAQHRPAAYTAASGHHRKCDGSQHECDGCVGCGTTENCACGSGAERSLAAGPAERCGDVSALPVLQNTTIIRKAQTST